MKTSINFQKISSSYQRLPCSGSVKLNVNFINQQLVDFLSQLSDDRLDKLHALTGVEIRERDELNKHSS